MLFEDRILKIMTYNIESIIAEKFQTVISRGVLNSRMKDYYDLYYLITYKEFSKDILKIAINKTFEKRKTDISNVESVLNNIKKADFIKDLWKNYSNHYPYASEIKFEEVISAMEKLSCIIN